MKKEVPRAQAETSASTPSRPGSRVVKPAIYTTALLTLTAISAAMSQGKNRESDANKTHRQSAAPADTTPSVPKPVQMEKAMVKPSPAPSPQESAANILSLIKYADGLLKTLPDPVEDPDGASSYLNAAEQHLKEAEALPMNKLRKDEIVSLHTKVSKAWKEVAIAYYDAAQKYPFLNAVKSNMDNAQIAAEKAGISLNDIGASREKNVLLCLQCAVQVTINLNFSGSESQETAKDRINTAIEKALDASGVPKENRAQLKKQYQQWVDQRMGK